MPPAFGASSYPVFTPMHAAILAIGGRTCVQLAGVLIRYATMHLQGGHVHVVTELCFLMTSFRHLPVP